MAVSKHIIDLTRLALADRVLTYKERETIVKEALAEGIPEPEINAFMDNMLAQRLKSLTKEELKNCPACGGQIPLIADQCPFCGNKFETGQAVSDVSGQAADIIRAENLKTAKEEESIKNCPDCGAPFPLISNICTHCGHVLHARQDSDLNIRNLIDNINDSIKTITNAPKPTFLDVLKYHKGTIMLFIGIVLFVSAFTFSDVTAGCLLMVALPLGFFGVKIQMKSLGGMTTRDELINNINNHLTAASPVTIADEIYYTALNDHNKYVRLTESVYGDNPEAKKFIAQLGGELQKAEENRKSNRLKLALFVALLTVISLLPLFLSPSSSTKFEEYIHQHYSIFENHPTNE